MFGRALDEDGEGCLAHEPRRTGVSIEIAVHVTRPLNGAGYAGERNPMNQGREIFVESLCLGRIAPQPAEVSLLTPYAIRSQGANDPPPTAPGHLHIQEHH